MKLHYKTIGSGPPLIFLHGVFGMLDNWKSIAKKMEDKYTCVLVDLRNHGKSPKDNTFDYASMADDLVELMDDMKISSTHLLGHSMGGKVAMQFSLVHPEKVDKLIVVDIAPRSYEPHHHAVIEAIRSLDPSAIEERAEAEEIFQKYLGNDQSTILFLMKNLDRLTNGGFQWKANMDVITSSYEEVLKEITSNEPFQKPTLFIRGALSNSVRDEDWENIRDLFPKAQLVTIEEADHWVHADQPEAIIDAIEGFLFR